MWYEILPSAILVAGFLSVPPIASWGVNYYFYSKKYVARDWENHPQDYHLYTRDRRVTGCEYVPRGLEGIKDEE